MNSFEASMDEAREAVKTMEIRNGNNNPELYKLLKNVFSNEGMFYQCLSRGGWSISESLFGATESISAENVAAAWLQKNRN